MQGTKCAISKLIYGLSVCTDNYHPLKFVAYRLVHTDEPYINLHKSHKYLLFQLKMYAAILLSCKIFIYLFNYLFIQYFKRVTLLAIKPIYQVALYNNILNSNTNAMVTFRMQ